MEKLRDLVSSSLTNNHESILLRTAKYALGIASIWQLNQLLNSWALNGFKWRNQGGKWDFSGQKELAVVTGGSNGFGRLIVKGLAPKMRIIVLDIVELPPELQALPNVTFYRCDLSSTSAIIDTANTIRQNHGAPTILINNAGIATSHTLLETSDAWLEKIFRINALSHFTLIREFLPGMLAQKKGHIVTLASMASYVATASLVDYAATKFAVLGMHNGLRAELQARYNNGECIRTTIVCPMWARTGLISTWQSTLLSTPGGFTLEPDDVANAVVRQVLSGRSGYVYLPRHYALAAGFAGWPQWIQDLMMTFNARLTVRGKS